MRLGARKTSFAALLTLAGSMAMLLAGCQGLTSDTTAVADSQQIFHNQIIGESDITTLDPGSNTDLLSNEAISVVWPGLLTLDSKLNVEPWAAQTLPTVSSDGKSYTFKLRPNLRWSDGTPITSQTFAYSMNRAEDPCTGSSTAFYLYMLKDAQTFNNNETCVNGKISGKIQTLVGDALETPDAQTLIVHLAQPAAYFLQAMTYPTSDAVPQQLISAHPSDWTQHLTDNGGFGGNLYKVTKWDHTGHLVLDRNDAFWGAKPKLREIDISFYTDTTMAYNSYLSGGDDIGVAPTEQLATARTNKNFHQIGVQQIDYYAMNWKMAPFDDVRVRQAFDLALDKTSLANKTLKGSVLASNHIIPDGMPGYNPGLKGPDDTTNLAGDVSRATSLAAAYAKDNKCGTAIDFSGCPAIALTIASGSVDAANEATAAQKMWGTAFPKWKITITSMDFHAMLTAAAAKKMQFWQLGWVESYPDPQDWLSTNLSCVSVYNAGSACDSQADQLMKAADANADPNARLTQYQQAEQILTKKVAWLTLDQATAWWEVRPWVVNFDISASGLTPLDTWRKIYIAKH